MRRGEPRSMLGRLSLRRARSSPLAGSGWPVWVSYTECDPGRSRQEYRRPRAPDPERLAAVNKRLSEDRGERLSEENGGSTGATIIIQPRGTTSPGSDPRPSGE